MIGALYVIGTVGSSIWVFFDAPRHGLSRGWSLGCLLVWVVFFPWYLIERSKAGEGPRGHTGAKPRSGWRARVFMDRHRRPAAVALAVALPLTMAGIWELRLLFRGPYMLFVVRHPALISIPLLLAAAAFVVHLSLKLAARAVRRGAAEQPPEESSRRSRKRGTTVQAPGSRTAAGLPLRTPALPAFDHPARGQPSDHVGGRRRRLTAGRREVPRHARG